MYILAQTINSLEVIIVLYYFAWMEKIIILLRHLDYITIQYSFPR